MAAGSMNLTQDLKIKISKIDCNQLKSSLEDVHSINMSNNYISNNTRTPEKEIGDSRVFKELFI
jgi:ABC-type metal ion transport system substrate-binding protein